MSGPLPLSIAIVCKNSGATIARTLDSVAPLASEIIALDSGSTDNTLAILAGANATVHHIQWQGHVATKQRALDSCSQPWILALDADESLTPPLASSIRAAITSDNPSVRAYELNRKVFFRGAWLHHAWQPEWRLRLVRKDAARWTGLDPHDRLDLLNPSPSAVARLQGDLRHDSFLDAHDCFRKQADHARTSARSLLNTGRRASILSLLTSPTGAFLKQLILKQSFRDGWRGWIAASATASATLMKHATLLDLQNAPSDTDPPRAH
ncbi:MAG: glycosyltransferase family 2 protein [Phycisphaerales bacterium]